MNRLPASEREFNLFAGSIRKMLHKRERFIMSPGNYRPAAVIILLMLKNGQPYILVTKRSENLVIHSGQVSLPGGGHDLTDNTILQTALRETHEEVGIDSGSIDVLGQFDDYYSIHGFHVSSFIGTVPYPVEYEINPHEIEFCIEVPLNLFLENKPDRTELREVNGVTYNILYFYYENIEIWGMTAAILTDFAQKVISHLHE